MSQDIFTAFEMGISRLVKGLVGSQKASTETLRRTHAFKAGGYFVAILPILESVPPELNTLFEAASGIPSEVIAFLKQKKVTPESLEEFAIYSTERFVAAIKCMEQESEFQNQVFNYDIMEWEEKVNN